MSTATPATPAAAVALGPPAGDAPAPTTTLGAVRISDAVVAKLAAQIALELPDVGGASPRLLGHRVPGAGHLGIRQTSLASLPKTTAQVDGDRAFIELSVSVRWPASVPQVTAQLRERVRDRLHEWTGLAIAEVGITVTGLVADKPGPRVL